MLPPEFWELLPSEPDDPLEELVSELDDPVEFDEALCLKPAALERFDSAGSCPDTSTTAINSHTVTNSVTAPATIQCRIARTRRLRAARIALPEGVGIEAAVVLMIRFLGSLGPSSVARAIIRRVRNA
jgi:hypothetical protein